MKHPINKLKKEADKWFSRYIRLRDNGICFTCMCKDDTKRMQAGHFIPRNISNTRYDEKNTHCQCVGCNMFNKGRMDVYAVELEAKYGQGILQELAEKKKVRKQFKEWELQEIIDLYKQKIKELEGGDLWIKN
jgi:hypothetical protein